MVALSDIEWVMDPDVTPFWEKPTRELYFGAHPLRVYRSTSHNNEYPVGTLQVAMGQFGRPGYVTYCIADAMFAVHAILAAATFDPPPQE